VEGQDRGYLAAIDASSGALAGWQPNANGIVYALTLRMGLHGATAIYAGGSFTSVGGQPHNDIAQIAPNGTAAAWEPNADGSVDALTFWYPNVYAGGDFASIGGQARGGIAALDVSTGLASAWTPDANGKVDALLLTGSTVYAGGLFTSIGGQPRNRLAALNRSSGVAPGWDPHGNRYVYALGRR